jgi:hypothetical protein
MSDDLLPLVVLLPVVPLLPESLDSSLCLTEPE